MRVLYAAVLLFLSVVSSAQKIRFTDDRNQWMTIGSAADGGPFQHHLSYVADTVVNGIAYKHINDNFSNFFPCPSYYGACTSYYGGSRVYFLTREDTLSGLVYYRNVSVSATDTAEHILYNYNLNIGDSITYGGILTDTVASMDSIIIGGAYHKIFNFQNKTYGHMRSYTVLEGVGCTNNPLFPAYFGTCFEYGESLFCFSQDGYRPSILAPVNSCAAFATYCCSLNGSVFDNSIGCGSALSDKDIKKKPAEFTIGPNPANKLVILSGNSSFSQNTLVSVYGITGNCIFRSEAGIGKEYMINTASWPGGLYMVTVQDDGGIIQKEKIVVAH